MRASDKPAYSAICSLEGSAIRQILRKISYSAFDPALGIGQMNRNADRSRFIGNRPQNFLANPPGTICCELIPPLIFIFFDRYNQAFIAFLDQVFQIKTSSGISFRNADNQPQIGFNEDATVSIGISLRVAPLDFIEFDGFLRSQKLFCLLMKLK